MTQQPPTETGETGDGAGTTYDVPTVEQKWQQVWDELDPFRADDAGSSTAPGRSATR